MELAGPQSRPILPLNGPSAAEKRVGDPEKSASIGLLQRHNRLCDVLCMEEEEASDTSCEKPNVGLCVLGCLKECHTKAVF